MSDAFFTANTTAFLREARAKAKDRLRAIADRVGPNSPPALKRRGRRLIAQIDAIDAELKRRGEAHA